MSSFRSIERPRPVINEDSTAVEAGDRPNVVMPYVPKARYRDGLWRCTREGCTRTDKVENQVLKHYEEVHEGKTRSRTYKLCQECDFAPRDMSEHRVIHQRDTTRRRCNQCDVAWYKKLKRRNTTDSPQLREHKKDWCPMREGRPFIFEGRYWDNNSKTMHTLLAPPEALTEPKKPARPSNEAIQPAASLSSSIPIITAPICPRDPPTQYQPAPRTISVFPPAPPIHQHNFSFPFNTATPPNLDYFSPPSTPTPLKHAPPIPTVEAQAVHPLIPSHRRSSRSSRNPNPVYHPYARPLKQLPAVPVLRSIHTPPPAPVLGSAHTPPPRPRFTFVEEPFH